MSLDRTRERLRRASVLDLEDGYLRARFQNASLRFGRDLAKPSRINAILKIREFCQETPQLHDQIYSSVVSELLARPIRDFLQGTVTRIEFTAHKGALSVRDDGLGLPIEYWDARRGISHLERQLSSLTNNTPSPPLNFVPSLGFGPVLVNAVAESLTVESNWRGKLWRQFFQRGAPKSELLIVGPSSKPGTAIEFKADPEIFGDWRCPLRDIRRILFFAAHLFPGLQITFNGQDDYSSSGLGDLGRTLQPLKSFQNPFFEFSVETEALILSVAAMGRARRCDELCWLNATAVAEGAIHGGLRLALEEISWTPSLALVHVVSKSPDFDPQDPRESEDPALAYQIQKALSPALRDFAFKES